MPEERRDCDSHDSSFALHGAFLFFWLSAKTFAKAFTKAFTKKLATPTS
jgi:hypothetical protein